MWEVKSRREGKSDLNFRKRTIVAALGVTARGWLGQGEEVGDMLSSISRWMVPQTDTVVGRGRDPNGVDSFKKLSQRRICWGRGGGVGEWLRTTGFLTWITRKPAMGDVEDGTGDAGDMLVLWPFEHLQPLRDSSDCLRKLQNSSSLGPFLALRRDQPSSTSQHLCSSSRCQAFYVHMLI